MTLNASGPISLGGSTVGQSINLELGNSATALASINTTQFRTLAGVASGQISLSNFYGKSSSTAYITYLGASSTSGTNVITNFGWAVNNLGVSAFKLTSLGRTTWIASNGTSITSRDYSPGASGVSLIFPSYQNKLTSTTDYVPAAQQDRFTQVYSSSNTYATSITSQRATSPNPSFGAVGMVGLPNNTVGYMGYYDQGKYGLRMLVWTVNPATNTQINSVISNANYAFSPIFAKMLVLTTGTFYLIHEVYSGSAVVYMADSTLTSVFPAQQCNEPNGQRWGGAVVDSSNNLYMLSSAGLVCKYNSSFSTCNTYSYNTVSPAFNTIYQSTSNWGMDIYNDIIYIASSAGSGGPLGQTLTIIAITASTMAVLWCKRFVLGGTNFFWRPITYSTFGTCIQARPTGVYVSFQANTSSNTIGGDIYTMCLPLAGNVTNQTVTISGTSQTLTITSPTTTVTTGSAGVSTVGDSGFTSTTSYNQANYTSSSISNLTTVTKTAF